MTAVLNALTPDANRLLAGLVEIGAIDPQRAAEAGQRFAERCPNGDATLLADHLTQHGLLSSFQAERALVGGPERLELGRYLLVEPVGHGSVGTTFLAIARPGGDRFALRVLPLRSTWRTYHARQRMEAFAALPEHPVVVPFVDVDTAAGRHYLAWPWAEGHPLDRYVLRNGPIPSADATRLFADLADGLRALHTAGLPHGLIRPRSLLLGMDRRPRILDAGLGAVLADNVGDERSMVDTLALASGSAAMADFAAPETLLDPTALSPAADAYSFGCCLYFVLTGLPPFPEELLSDKVIGHQQRSPVPVRTRNPDVPQVLADLIDRLMRKAPDERPSQFAEVRAELRAIADLPEMGGELTTSKSFTSVKAEALAALGKAASGSWTHARRADLPPASDVVDFDDVPLGPPPPPPQDDSQALTPPPPRRPPPPPPSAPVERRMPSAEGGPRLKAAVEIPSPPAFDSAAARAVRSVLFWKKAADAVQLSVFGPPELAPGQRARLLVYAHLPDAFGGVATLCRALHPDAELLGTGYIQRPVRRDSVLQLHLQLTGGGVPKPMVEFTWTGQTHPRSFEVAVPLEAGGGVADGVLSAGQGEQKVGEVVFQILIGGLGLGRGGG